MIKFTNAVERYRGNPIFINKEHIIAVYEHARDPGGSLVTIVYGGNGICWEVEEGLDEVIKKIKDTG